MNVFNKIQHCLNVLPNVAGSLKYFTGHLVLRIILTYEEATIH